MPREPKNITNFGGIVGVFDQEDIPDNFAVDSLNVDADSITGILQGRPTESASYKVGAAALVPNVFMADWIKYDASGTEKWDLVYINQALNDIIAIENFYDDTDGNRIVNNLVTSPTGTVSTVKTFGKAVQIGLGNGSTEIPYVIYRLLADRNFFNSGETVTAGIQSEKGRVLQLGFNVAGGIYPVSLTFNAGAGYFQTGILYAWAVTLVFDGIQESSIISNITGLDKKGAGGIPGATSSDCDVDIRAYNGSSSFASFDKRITAIKLYRAESADTTVGNLGLYRLVKTIEINDSGWAVSGNHYELTYNDDGSHPAGGATYEEESGIPEDIEFPYVHYSINAVGSGFHAMAKAYVPPNTGGIPTPTDWDRYIFFSKRYRPNMVDWSNDFVTIPLIPVALAHFQERFYAFAENTIYRINPETKTVEDEFFGVGCSGQRAVTVTELGMFFANNNGAYWFDGRIVRTISDIIRRSSAGGSSWSTIEPATTTAKLTSHIVLYEAYKKYLLFIGDVSDSPGIWALYIPSLNQRIPRWDYWTLTSLSSDNRSGAFGGKDGEVFFSDVTQLFALFYGNGATDPDGLTRGTTVTDFEWTSKEFNLNEPGQDKKFYKVIYDKTGAGTLTVKYANEGTTPTSGVGTSIASGTYITAADQKKKSIQLYFSSSGVVKVDSAEILFRKLRGKR